MRAGTSGEDSPKGNTRQVPDGDGAAMGKAPQSPWPAVRHFDFRRYWNRFRRSRAGKVTLITLGILFTLAVIADFALDEPIRKVVERRANAELQGYTASVPKLDFHLLGLSMTLHNVRVVQDAHPDPPVIAIPRLRMSVQWLELLRLRMVADCTFQNPSVNANLAQLQEEDKDQVRLDQKGWQDALQAIYPLKINKMVIHGGSLVYQETASEKPLEATKIELTASNIRNIRSKDRVYPSPVHVTGNVFDVGRAEIKGHADFLAKPHPGIKAELILERLDLAYFAPVLDRYALQVRRGLMSGSGRIEHGAGVEIVDLDQVVIADASVDYLYGGEPHEKARAVAREVRDAAKKAMNAPEKLFRVRYLRLQDGTIGFVNRTTQPPYRLFVTGADFELQNLSSRSEDGVARATLQGSLMGTGKVQAAASFFPEGKDPNFGMKLEIAETQLKNINPMLKAHGNFDVAGGEFSLYMDLRVKDRQVRGYVKPLFRDINVYDPSQDKHESPMHKVYEKMVGVVAKILRNRRDEVATVATISGPVENPQSNTVEILGGLLKNAFVKSILPGFENEVSKVNPAYYRHWKKQRDAKRSES